MNLVHETEPYILVEGPTDFDFYGNWLLTAMKSEALATKATRGGGPRYCRFGPRVLYRWNDALAWAEGRLTAPHCSTSEQDAPTTIGSLAKSGSRS
jgi:hypothetical protein